MDRSMETPPFDRASIETLSKVLGDPPGLAAARRLAFERYEELPLEPNPLYRQYGYFQGVDLGAIDPIAAGPPVTVPAPGSRTVQAVHDGSGTRLQLGRDLRNDPHLRIRTLREIWSAPTDGAAAFAGTMPEFTDRLTALSAAVLNRGYELEVTTGPEAPVQVQDITVLSRPHEALAIRRSVRVGRGARVTISEETFSAPGHDEAQRLLSSSTALRVDDDAVATMLLVHAPDPRVVGIYHRTAEVGARARVAWIWSGFGGFRTKVRNVTELHGNGSSADDLQTFYGDGEQSYDSSMQMTHRGTDTHGQSITRGVFRDTARGMSRGLVRIEKDARKTLSYLSEHAMLLSKGARSDTIPILEILCRDVKATHSSSVAPVDPEKVFYLESRGMPESEAVRMIGEGFLSHVFERAPIQGLREVLYPYLERRWDRKPIRWTAEAPPSLPSLAATGTGAEAEWRFDTKLR